MIIDYLLCQYAKVKCGKIELIQMHFTITVAVKNIQLLQKIASAH